MKTLVRLLCVALLLGLASSPAWAQPQRHEAVGIQGRQPGGQPREDAPDIPVDDLDRGTPRRIDVESMSDSPAGHIEDALPPDIEHVGRIDTPGKPVHIRLQRVPREDGVGIWQVSATSVAAIPGLYGRYAYGLGGEALPSVFLETEFLDTQLWQWLALPILVVVGYGLGLLVTTLGFRLLRRWRSELASVLGTFVAGPVRLLITVFFLSLARRPLQLSFTVSRVLDVLEQVLLIIAITWAILRVVGSFEAIVHSHALRRDKISLLPLLPVVRKSVKILIATFAGVAVLHNFGVNVITVLAGLGVGGIAMALAAQKTLENFIGGITLYVDQPVRVGEFCRFGGTVGTVEGVGLRSTRVRTLDRTVVTVPNAEFSSLQIENSARRDRIWYHPAIHLRYETTPDQIRYILVEAHRMLYAHPKVDSASARIRFIGFDNSSLTLEVFGYVIVTDYGEYLEVAEDLNPRIMDIVAASGSSFALPSQTTYLEEGHGPDPDRARAVEAQVNEWRERRELWLPRVPHDKIAEIENTLEYPAAGSATGTERGRQ